MTTAGSAASAGGFDRGQHPGPLGASGPRIAGTGRGGRPDRPGLAALAPPAAPGLVVAAGRQAAAVDWLTRVRPAVWLQAAGFAALSTELRRWRVTDPAAAKQVVTILADHSAALAVARDTAWRPVRQRLFARAADSPELWSQVVDGTRRAAAGAAAHRLADAAAACHYTGADACHVLAAVEPQLLWQRVAFPRTEVPRPWPLLVDMVTHAAHIVAWAGVDQLDRQRADLLDPADSALAWGYAFDAATAATAEVVAHLDRLAAVQRPASSGSA